jgi:FkbM family methyltransferase
MGLLKKLLYKLLSQRAYLKTLHRSFYLLYSFGFLKKDARFKYHYMVKQLIQPDFTVVDLGANLGYFSKTFARLAKNGKLISIEPVPVFYDTLSYFMKGYSNTTIYNVALGTEEGSITMVLPESNGMIRTGLPHIAESEEEKQLHATQEVKIVKGSNLLSDLTKIDYIKCDIEGYELNVFQEIKPILEQHLPFVQIEIAEKNLDEMLRLFNSLGYTQFGIKDFKFIKESGEQAEEGDFFFVPENRLVAFEKKFIKIN